MEWPAVLTAVSTMLIALMMLVLGVGGIVFMRDLVKLLNRLESAVGSLEHDARPALESARRAADEANKMFGTLRGEIDAVADTSRELRFKLSRAVDAVEDRLLDLDALVEVAQSELEETVLDVAAALRTGRRSKTIFKSIKRALGGRSR